MLCEKRVETVLYFHCFSLICWESNLVLLIISKKFDLCRNRNQTILPINNVEFLKNFHQLHRYVFLGDLNLFLLQKGKCSLINLILSEFPKELWIMLLDLMYPCNCSQIITVCSSYFILEFENSLEQIICQSKKNPYWSVESFVEYWLFHQQF